MRIGIMADSHEHLPNIRKCVAYFESQGIRTLLHAGDFIAPFALMEVQKFTGRLFAVLGNNDGEVRGLKALHHHLTAGTRKILIENRTILMAHILEDLDISLAPDADVLVHGHTHRPEIIRETPLRINPGESGAWLTGQCTVAVLDLETLHAEIVEL